MPKLHVVYDPTDKLNAGTLPPEMKVAVISIAEDMLPDEIGQITEQLAELLLEQFGPK